MPSTYSSSLRLELQATGENSNTWGTKTNNNLNLIEQAVAGYVKITLVSASATYNLTIDNASASDGRNAFIEFAGTVASAISVVVPDVEKGYWVKNSATGSNLTFRTSGGTGFTLPQNDWIFVISDGVSAYPVTTSLTNYARINQANTFTNTNNFTSAVNISGPVSITGATVITSATDIRANLSVTGTTNLVGNVVVSGATTLASAVDIKGATSLASTLVVGGATDIRANLSVTGATNIVGNVVVSGSTILASTVDIKGATSLASTLVVGGNTTLNGSVSVSGSFAVSGASTFTSVVNIRANASVVGNFLVSGATTLASTVDIRGATSIASTLDVAGIANFKSLVSVSGNFTASGFTTLQTTLVQKVFTVDATAVFTSRVSVSAGLYAADGTFYNTLTSPDIRAKTATQYSRLYFNGLDVGLEGTGADFAGIFFYTSGVNSDSTIIQYASAYGSRDLEIYVGLGSLNLGVATSGQNINLEATTINLRVAGSTLFAVSVSAVTMFSPTRFVRRATPPATPVGGEVYYDTSANMLRCYNGTTWKDLF